MSTPDPWVKVTAPLYRTPHAFATTAPGNPDQVVFQYNFTEQLPDFQFTNDRGIAFTNLFSVL